MLYTQQNVRDNIRNRDGKRVFFLGKNDQLTAGARDWLNGEKIPILPAEDAKIDLYRLQGGGFVQEKPEHMTHLHGDVLVCKTHPRIAFRGAMDLLESEIMLCQLVVEPDIRKELGDILRLARQLIRCDVLDEPLAEGKLCGLDEKELRNRSHRPQDYYGQPHFMPEYMDGAAMLQMNRTRCIARYAEQKAVAAFSDREGNPTRTDIIRALNRISSMLWILMIQMKKGK